MTTQALDALETIDHLASANDIDGILDVLLEGWDDDYQEGRRLLLQRLRQYRGLTAEKAASIAPAVYRALIVLGEDLADMRWVHLAVESRDALLYGI
jgi:hypothetical protein